MTKATCPIDGEPTIREIVAELASGAYIEPHDDGRYELRQPGKFIGSHTLQHHLIRDGWLESFANGGGYRLSSDGWRAYMRSTDELGSGELVPPLPSGVSASDGQTGDGGVLEGTNRTTSGAIGQP